jgi:hypothetical protein
MLNQAVRTVTGYFWLIGVVMRFVVWTLCIALPVVSFAADNSWLKKNSPNELFANVTVSKACPMSRASMENVVEGVFVRSRIKKLDSWRSGEIVLYVEVYCLHSYAVYIFDINEYLAKLSRNGDENIVLQHALKHSYGSFGRGREEFIVNSIQESVREALVDYVKANFDLGE